MANGDVVDPGDRDGNVGHMNVNVQVLLPTLRCGGPILRQTPPKAAHKHPTSAYLNLLVHSSYFFPTLVRGLESKDLLTLSPRKQVYNSRQLYTYPYSLTQTKLWRLASSSFCSLRSMRPNAHMPTAGSWTPWPEGQSPPSHALRRQCPH